MSQQNSNVNILNARDAFNSAIAEKDAKRIHSLLAPSYHIVTGRSDQFHGADAEETRWAELFQNDPTAIYHRIPSEIATNETWGIAQEHGEWRGSYTLNSKFVQASGVYSAKWQRTTIGTWVLQAEVFTTINFDDACIPPAPID